MNTALWVSAIAVTVLAVVAAVTYRARKRRRVQTSELVDRAERVSAAADQTAEESRELLQALRQTRLANHLMEAVEDAMRHDEGNR